jgi:Ca2+-binding RTX toxin-like protein
MKRTVMLMVGAMAAALVMASGVAWAATVQCQVGALVCEGTPNADSITGTSGKDFIRGFAGADLAKGMGDADIVQGGKGKDTVKGGAGPDTLVFGGESGPNGFTGPFTDASDDFAYGGVGADYLLGGYAQGGVDHVYGEDGNDNIHTYQRGLANDLGMKVTKEIVNCGAGQDTVAFDQDKDEVAQNCEIKYPVGPGGVGAPD